MNYSTIITVCPLCHRAATVIDADHTAYRGTDRHRILECEYCDLQFATPMTVPPGLYDDIYRNAERLPGYDRYSHYRNQVKSQPNPLLWLAEQEAAYWFIRAEISATPRARILEIGSGLGYLTYAIRTSGYDIIGIDIAIDATRRAEANFGDFYRCQDLFDLVSTEGGTFDIVVMTEVIEHVPDPVAFLIAAAALKPGGKLLVTTPNKSFWPLGMCWNTENPPVHLWWFSEAAMRRLAEKSGLAIRFFDFSGLYRSERAPKELPRVSNPAFLEDSGNPSAAAAEWFAGRRGRRSLKPFLGPLRPLVLTAQRARYAWLAFMQRNEQMGIVLTRRPA